MYIVCMRVFSTDWKMKTSTVIRAAFVCALMLTQHKCGMKCVRVCVSAAWTLTKSLEGASVSWNVFSLNYYVLVLLQLMRVRVRVCVYACLFVCEHILCCIWKAFQCVSIALHWGGYQGCFGLLAHYWMLAQIQLAYDVKWHTAIPRPVK